MSVVMTGDDRPLAPFDHSTPESWQQQYDINLRHVFAVTRALVPSMIDAQGGSIVTVHSVEGMRGYPKDPVYGAMKAAAAHFTTCLPVDGGTEAGGGWLFSPREGRFVNRSRNL